MRNHPDATVPTPNQILRKGRMGARPSRRAVSRKKSTRRMRGGSARDVYVFYHIFCNKNTLEIVRDQTTKIVFSGLYDDSKAIYCFLTGDAACVKQVQSFLETLPKKFVVKEVGVDDKTFERFTLNKIANNVGPKDAILYMHSKGVLRTSGQKVGFEPTYLWRNYLEYYLIRHYKKCLEKLATHDVVGALYKDFMIGPHFSGNFWWTTGEYFKRLTGEHKIGEAYYDPEAYIFKSAPKNYRIDSDKVPNMECFYKRPYYGKLYMDDPVV